MFPSFIGILDIQSWWEVPSIAYFCSLFRTAFNLLDFDIEELEEALLTDGTEETSSTLLTELIVRLLNGCLGNNEISAFNFQMYLRRLFRRKCQDTGRYNPFNTDIDFQFLPLRTKVEILYALCDFRLDAEDVFDLFKNLEAESLRVEPLGWDDNDSAYWYFYGTRLYREDIIKKGKTKPSKRKKGKKRGWFYGDDWLEDEVSERVWQVVCFTEEDWNHLTDKFSKATSKIEKELHRSLSQNFLPEIPRLFEEKERLQRKRLLEHAPRRASSRVLQKIKQKEEESSKPSESDSTKDQEYESKDKKDKNVLAREIRARRRDQLRRKSSSSKSESSSEREMPQRPAKRQKMVAKRSKNSSATQKGEPPPDLPTKTGRKTNNSLASATGQILIPDVAEPTNSTRKKLKTSQIFSQTEEDIQTDMYKVLEQLIAHEDAWPFMDPVEEEYAPNYYAVIRRPMDLRKMEERLDSGFYTDISMFKADFKLIVNNCRLYNGQDNEYTTMVDNLQAAFDRLTEKYITRVSSSDEEIAVEYQIPTPRKHKMKRSESPVSCKRKRRKTHTDDENDAEEPIVKKPTSSVSPVPTKVEKSKSKSKSSSSKEGKTKKKHRGHHRHGKHSKNKKGDSKHSKKQKHSKNKGDKKEKSSKKRRNKGTPSTSIEEPVAMSITRDSDESSGRSRSASPLPSIHTLSPSPEPEPQPPIDFYKDKFDKIKERRRQASTKDTWDTLTNDPKSRIPNVPEKDKNRKLTETIEKMKAKNDPYKMPNLFGSLFSAGTKDHKNKKTPQTKESDDPDYSEFDSDDSDKPKSSKRGPKKVVAAKNESASEALEQAVKDISKWLDDAPKGSSTSSICDSPAQTISTEEQDSRLDDEFAIYEKNLLTKKDCAKKRLSSRENKQLKKREIQRTIDRLQPGKSKGNLLTNVSTKITDSSEDVTSTSTKSFDDVASPKLSLGSVLGTVEFTVGNDHKFDKDDLKVEEKSKIQKVEPEKVDESTNTENYIASPKVEVVEEKTKVVEPEPEVEPPSIMKPSQEKATPNLSAWFKAFGAPKSTPSNTNTNTKKKVEEPVESEEKSVSENIDNKQTSPKVILKYDSPTEPETPNPNTEEVGSPSGIVGSTPRQRRTSTGSSVSERSSFSQDLDSPRHQMSHNSPLLRSPASPRTEDFQKVTYPIINGTIRAGFYQDTTSMKSSPEKSCSPREGPQSPYSPYAQHVYASNNPLGSTTPNYFAENKSPLAAYPQNQQSTYDLSSTKSTRANEDLNIQPVETYIQSQYAASYSQPTTYPPKQQETYHSSNSPQPMNLDTHDNPPSALSNDPKPNQFPVKKRMYNESDVPNFTKANENKTITTSEAEDYHKMVQTMHSINSLSTPVDTGHKTELNKRKDKQLEYKTHPHEAQSTFTGFNKLPNASKKETPVNEPIRATIASNANKNSIDMVNMGYMNPEMDRRNCAEASATNYGLGRDIHKQNVHSHPKGHEIDAIAMNLGLNNQNLLKSMTKPILSSNNSTSNVNSGIIPQAHSHDSRHNESAMSHLMNQCHVNYNAANTSDSMNNFTLSDIEMANKKLYSCNAPTSIDYGNWKMTNQMRKDDRPEFSGLYPCANDKLKIDFSTSTSSSTNTYNKSIQQPHYQNYNLVRAPSTRPQQVQSNLNSELRIPNPRNVMKTDHNRIENSHVTSTYTNEMAKTDVATKVSKADKIIQNHPLVGSLPYKTPYSTHSTLPLEGLRNLPNMSQMLERYTNDERYLSSFAAGAASLYHDKTFQMAQMSQMFNKSMAPDAHSTVASMSYSSQPSITMTKESNAYKNHNPQMSAVDSKSKTKRKRVTETSKTSQNLQAASQSYHPTSHASDVISASKPMVPGSAFNFGNTSNMPIASGLYTDSNAFSMDDFRNTTANHLMAANYMVAAVAHQRNNTETATEKIAKPAHQSSTHSGATFPFMAHGQSRGGYPFVGGDPSSPLYQQYLQRHQEELLRQTGAQIMGLYPPGYPASLSARQPYDSINRPSWL